MRKLTLNKVFKVESGRFPKDPDRVYCRVYGYNGQGEVKKAISFDAVASAIVEELAKKSPDLSEISSQKIVIELQGKPTERLNKTTGKVEESFTFETFTILNGPSLELARLRSNARETMEVVKGLFLADDVTGAYKALESLVADLAQVPAPSRSIGFDELLPPPNFEADAGLSPEEIAKARFDRRDTARGQKPVERKVEASPDLALADSSATDEVENDLEANTQSFVEDEVDADLSSDDDLSPPALEAAGEDENTPQDVPPPEIGNQIDDQEPEPEAKEEDAPPPPPPAEQATKRSGPRAPSAPAVTRANSSDTPSAPPRPKLPPVAGRPFGTPPFGAPLGGRFGGR